MTTKQRFLELDALRGIAAIMVVFSHYIYDYNYRYGHVFDINAYFNAESLFYHSGRFGVQLFFIVSGFVIFLTLSKTKQPADFFISRFSRIYPAYWASILLTFTILQWYPLNHYPVSLDTTLVNFSMLQTWFHVPHLNGTYWTLAVELSFYCWMLWLFIRQGLAQINHFALLWLELIWSALLIESYLGVRLPEIIRVTFLLEYGHLFIAGMMFYQLKHLDKAAPKRVLLFILALCLLTEYLLHGKLFTLIIGSYFGFFYRFSTGKTWPILVKPPLLFLGKISYSLYLLHLSIGYVIIQQLYAAGIQSPWLIIGTPTLASLLLASLAYYTIEKPSLGLIRQYWQYRQVNTLNSLKPN